MNMKPLYFLLCVFPALAQADALDDLRQRLDTLKSEAPLQARVQVQMTVAQGERGKEKIYNSASQFMAVSGKQGLQLSWLPAQLSAAETEALAHAKQPRPLSVPSSLDVLRVSEAAALLDHAPVLKLLLDGATLLEDRREPWQGKPARLLVLQLDAKLSEEQKKMVKTADAKLKLWLDASGNPLASEYAMQAKASKFFINVTLANQQNRRYRLVGNRLMVTSAVEETGSEGMGEVNRSTKTIEVSVVAG